MPRDWRDNILLRRRWSWIEAKCCCNLIHICSDYCETRTMNESVTRQNCRDAMHRPNHGAHCRQSAWQGIATTTCCRCSSSTVSAMLARNASPLFALWWSIGRVNWLVLLATCYCALPDPLLFPPLSLSLSLPRLAWRERDSWARSIFFNTTLNAMLTNQSNTF